MIIFIHGFGSTGLTSSTGKALVEAFPNEDIVRISYNYIDPDADVTHIIDTINAMSIDVTLVGISLGGFVARFIATQCPNVEKLIMLNPSLNAPESLKKYEGSTVNGRVVPKGFYEAFIPMTVEKDNPELPIYVAVCSDDDVVDPKRTIETYIDRADLLITEGGHRIPFNDDVKAFINRALNTVFG